MSGCRVRGLWAACGLALVCWGSVRAETAAGTAIAKLLEVGWSIAPQARVAADLQWSEVQRLAGSDVRAIEASWLVLMQQRRFDEALKRLDEHLAKSPDDFDALRAKAWVQTVLKNYAVAFVTADRLSVLLSKNRPTTEEGEVEHEEAIAFLGRLIGFYGGPAADLINQEERKSREKKWLDRLDESNKVVFEDARNGVLARYIDMTDESANAKERAIATAKAEKDKSLAELQVEGGKLDERAKELEEKRNKLNSEFKAEMDAISRQDQPLFAQQSQLATQASALETNLITLSAQISALQQLATNERNEALQQQYFAQLNSLSILASRTDADLFAVNRSLGNVQAQRNSLQTRRVQVQSSAAAQVNRLDRELAEIGQRERRNEAMEKRANRPVTTTSSKVRSLSAQASALSTYDTYPLEAAKEKLLRAVR
jgi:hypothetical protein